MEKFCRNCQKEFDSEMIFCLQCGSPLQTLKTANDKIVNCVFEFQCPLEWGKLDKTDIQGVRFCGTCQRNVHFVQTQTELDDLARAGECAAFHRTDNPITETTFEPPPLMGVMIPPERMAELIAEGEKERQQAAAKSWWQFWK